MIKEAVRFVKQRLSGCFILSGRFDTLLCMCHQTAETTMTFDRISKAIIPLHAQDAYTLYGQKGPHVKKRV